MLVFRSAVLVIAGPIAVRKHAAALFRREKFILLQVYLTGHLLVFTFLHTEKLKLGTRCSRDFAYATAGELSSINYHELLWPFDHLNDSW